LKVLDQVADGEIGGVAETVVRIFLADLASGSVGSGKALAAIAVSPEDCLDEPFMLPGQAAKEDRDAPALFGSEWPLDWRRKCCTGAERMPASPRRRWPGRSSASR
jgi:hypothetical protein